MTEIQKTILHWCKIFSKLGVSGESLVVGILKRLHSVKCFIHLTHNERSTNHDMKSVKQGKTQNCHNTGNFGKPLNNFCSNFWSPSIDCFSCTSNKLQGYEQYVSLFLFIQKFPHFSSTNLGFHSFFSSLSQVFLIFRGFCYDLAFNAGFITYPWFGTNSLNENSGCCFTLLQF